MEHTVILYTKWNLIGPNLSEISAPKLDYISFHRNSLKLYMMVDVLRMLPLNEKGSSSLEMIKLSSRRNAPLGEV